MRGQFLIGFLTLLISCAERVNEDTTEVHKESASKETSSPAVTIEPVNLEGKVFLIGQGMEDVNCNITEACDCCNADLFFLSDNRFILDNLCEGHFVMKGKYEANSTNLTLHFDPVQVSYYHNEESETNPSLPDYILEKESKQREKSTFSLGTCGGNMTITNHKEEDENTLLVGKLNQNESVEEKINLLRKLKIWDLLEVK